MNFSVVDDIGQVESITAEWDELNRRSPDPSPFLAPGWYLSWWHAFSDPSWDMRLGTVRDGGKLQAVAPLLIREEKRWGTPCRVLRFWADAYSNRANFIIQKENAPEIARVLINGLEGLQNEWDMAELGPIVLGETTTRFILNELGLRRAATGIIDGYSSPYCILPSIWEEMVKKLSSSFRQSLRRKVRKAHRLGAVVYFAEEGSAFPKALKISKDTWQHADDTGIGSTASIRAFFEEVVKWSEGRGSLQLAFLELEGEPVAFELNLVERDTLSNLKVGYRLEKKDLSPGLVLRYHVLRNAVERGLREFDFLGEDEPYKLHWASGVREHGQILWATPRLPWLAMHIARFRVRPLLKKRLPWAIPILSQIQRISRSVGGS